MELNELLHLMLRATDVNRTAFQIGVAPVHVDLDSSLFRIDHLNLNVLFNSHHNVFESTDESSNSHRALEGNTTDTNDVIDTSTQPIETVPSERHTQVIEHRPSGQKENRDDQPEREQPPYIDKAALCRLRPLLVFDVVPQGNELPIEFEIAPRVSVVIVPPEKRNVVLTQFDAGKRKRYISFRDGVPDSIRRDSSQSAVVFDERRKAKLQNGEQWSFRKVALGRLLKLGADGNTADSVALILDKDVWISSWMLTRKNYKSNIRDSSFLILCCK